MSEYDLRQYKLLLENAKISIKNMNTLKKTIDNIEGLIYAIEEKDNEWNKQFMAQWWILEEIHALNCFNELHSLSDSIIERVNQTRLAMIELLMQKIPQESNHLDDDN